MYREMFPEPLAPDVEVEGGYCPRCGAPVECREDYEVLVFHCGTCGYNYSDTRVGVY